MDVYVGRQPIFDRSMNVYGYELFYRRSDANLFESLDDSRAAGDLINSAFLMMQMNELTHGTKALIQFSGELMVKEIPLLLPKDSVVVELLERVEPLDEVIRACRKLKDSGYVLAVSEFVLEEPYRPLFDLADIIKVDFASVDNNLLAQYRGKRFLADRIETREDYLTARALGFHLFQGTFFSKPSILAGKGIEHVSFNLVRILNELSEDEPDFQKITEIVERDLGLSYKLLKVANSIAHGSRYKTNSMNQALVRIGTAELKKWVFLMMLKEVENKENKELIRTCLVRAKFMELLALDMGMKKNHQSYFITGLFSALDTLLNREMASIVNELPLPEEITDALLGKQNEVRELLEIVKGYESGSWENLDSNRLFKLFSKEKFMSLYVQALAWSMEMENLDVVISPAD